MATDTVIRAEPIIRSTLLSDDIITDPVKLYINWLDSLPEIPTELETKVQLANNPLAIDENLRFKTPTFIKEQNKWIFLTPALLKNFVAEINDLPVVADKLFVIVIGTGGTIAMSHLGPHGELTPDIGFEEMIRQISPRLGEQFIIMGRDFFKTDSSQLEIDDVGDMAMSMYYIWKRMKPSLHKCFAGFLVPHGTDTMPKSGVHLEMMFGKNMPFNIVHTGGQKPIVDLWTDSGMNLVHALLMLKMLHLNGCAESISVMGGKALLTCGMQKVSDIHAEAMKTFMHHDVVDFFQARDPDKYRLPRWLRRRPYYKKTGQFCPVIYRGPNRIEEINAEMQDDPRAIMTKIRLGSRLAIVLVTYGASTFDQKIVNLIAAEAKKRKIPVFATSPVNADPKLDVYYASEALIQHGITPIYMTADTARAKLMLLLGQNPQDTELVKQGMLQNFVGEIPTTENAHTA